jgi:hypothetical protein
VRELVRELVMQRNGVGEVGVMQANKLMQREVPYLARFFGKLVLDVLPAALASVIGGFLFTQYQFGRAPAPRLALEQVTPASAEMMRLVRDEHAAMMDYLKAQSAAEKSRLAAEDQDSARAVADAKTDTKTVVAEAAPPVAAAPTLSAPMSPAPMVAAAAPRHLSPALLIKSAAVRNKAPMVAAVTVPTHAPLVIAQADPNDGLAPAGAPREPQQSLLAKTLDIKDHVVDGALHVVTAIGSIPSWIASMGDRVGSSNGGGAAPDARMSQFNSW